jgi:F0F1-type ATP synthase beta subunit
MSIHRQAPNSIYQLHLKFYLGIKVIDLLSLTQRGKIGCLVVQVLVKVLIQELINNIARSRWTFSIRRSRRKNT